MGDDGEPPERKSLNATSPHSNGNRQAKATLFQHMRGWWRALVPARHDATIKEALEEAIEEVLVERQDELTLLREEETRILRNVLSFGETTVHEIMSPRSDIIAVPFDISLDDLKKMLAEQRHTRMPVYSESLDHVEGFLHMKDLLPMLSQDLPFDMAQVLRPMLFVPPSMRVVDLLVKMRAAGSHIAIVVDEYGGTDGLVTLEDVFEEIVGDIQDEHDDNEDEQKELVRTGEQTYEADARLRIERLEEELGIALVDEDDKEEDFDTLGGLIFYELGRVPSRGERVMLESGVEFEILDVDPRRIHRVRIYQQQLEHHS